jgi:diguanylate cyclase (GGDEF)-like protein
MPSSFGKLQRYHKPLLLTAALGLVVLIGWLRFLTGPEFAFSFLYLVPIVTVTWMTGRQWGLVISAVSAFSWLLVDLSMVDRFSRAYIPLVNEAFRFSVFLFIVFMIAKYKRILATQKELAMSDPLTGVANRRAFRQLATIEIDRSRRYQLPFSVMVIDVDNFKPINDQFGHHTGDRLLKTMVETIRLHLRAIDIIARFGGDEFVVLLVNTAETAAAMVTRKLQKQLLNKMKEKQWAVTFSIGLVTYHGTPDSVEETIRSADALMYEVKHNGKNDVRHAVF